ncbi:MAG: hypothetical protein ACRDGN_00880 [bacterium]
MGTVTYPSPAVQDFLDEHFVCAKVNEKDPTTSGRTFLTRYRLLWTPGFVFLDPRGAELRRQVGFLPPAEFVAEARIALGKIASLYGDHATAADHFVRAADQGSAEIAAEALYWAGIEIWRRDGRRIEVVRSEWEKLRQRFPKSTWWMRADVFE